MCAPDKKPPVLLIYGHRSWADTGRNRPAFTWRHGPGIDLQNDVLLHQVCEDTSLSIRSNQFRFSTKLESAYNDAFLGGDNSRSVAVEVEGKDPLGRGVKNR